jgi:hypothetical protein
MGTLDKAMQQLVAESGDADRAVNAVLAELQHKHNVANRNYEAAQIAKALNTPREKAFRNLQRLVFLRYLYKVVDLMKERGHRPFELVSTDAVIEPADFVLLGLTKLQTRIREIDSNLRRLAAIDGIDSPIYRMLGIWIEKMSVQSIKTIMAEWNTTEGFGDLETFLIVAEKQAFAAILLKVARRYRGDAPSFNLNRAIMDLAAEVATYNSQRMARTAELRTLYGKEKNGQMLTEYYRKLIEKTRLQS